MSSISGLGGTLDPIHQPHHQPPVAEFVSDPSNTPRPGPSESPARSGDYVDLTPAARVVQQLAHLQRTNPPEFKKVATAAADHWHATAQQTADPVQAALFANLAAKFHKSAHLGHLTWDKL
jgi:hypothetical protein